MINGGNMAPAETGKALVLRRLWQPGDKVELYLPMAPEALAAHPRVTEDRGAVALRRGPIVYCVESTDHEAQVWDLAVKLEDGKLPEGWEAVWHADLLGGVVTLEGRGCALQSEPEPLYGPATNAVTRTPTRIKAIPYYAWANRGSAAVRVWLARR
jgi:uncharacterized protein